MDAKITPTEDTVREVFSSIQRELNSLTHSDKTVGDRYDIIMELTKQLQEVKIAYIKDWHTVEGQIKIIQTFESHLLDSGNDLEIITNRISGNGEIQYHLKRGHTQP